MQNAKIGKLTSNSGLFVVPAFIGVFVLFTILDSSFAELNNLVNIVMRMTILVPIALGVMLALIVRGIDLSSGTVVGLGGIVLAMVIQSGQSLALGILMVLALGLLVGFLNGMLIGNLNMNPFIATLAMMFIGNSVESVLTGGGLPIYLHGSDSGLEDIFRSNFFGIPIPIVLLIVIVLVFYVLLERTVYGRRLYATGSSIGGATNAGIPVRTYYVAAYTISAVLAVVAGILVASQVRSGQPTVGQSYLWDAIGAAFLSTILSKSARPNVLGTLFGVAFLAMVTNGLTILGIEFYWMGFFRGLIILFILLASTLNMRRSVHA